MQYEVCTIKQDIVLNGLAMFTMMESGGAYRAASPVLERSLQRNPPQSARPNFYVTSSASGYMRLL